MPQSDLDAIGTDVEEETSGGNAALAESKSIELEAIKEQNRADEAKADKALGYFGKFFGSPENAIFNMVFLITVLCIVLTVGGFLMANDAAVEVFKTAMFMGIGFLVGQKVSK